MPHLRFTLSVLAIVVALALLAVPALRSVSDWRRDRAAATWIDVHRQQALAAEQSGDFALAESTWAAAIAFDDRDVELRRELLRTRLRRAAANPQSIDDTSRDTLRYALSVLDDGGTDASALVVRGHLAVADGQPDRAKALYEQAIAADGSAVHAYLGLAALHRASGRPLDAQSAFEKAVEAAPDSVTALNNLGVQYLDLGRKDDALKSIERALAVKDNAASRLNAADVLAALGRLEEAIQHLGQAVKLAPKSAEARRRLGVALQRAGKLPEAEAALLASLSLERDVPTATLLGKVYQGEKRFDAAIDVLSRVLKDDADAHEAAFELARTLEVAGRGNDAADVYTRFVQKARGRPDQAERLAAAEAALGKLRPAPTQAPPSIP